MKTMGSDLLLDPGLECRFFVSLCYHPQLTGLRSRGRAQLVDEHGRCSKAFGKYIVNVCYIDGISIIALLIGSHTKPNSQSVETEGIYEPGAMNISTERRIILGVFVNELMYLHELCLHPTSQ